MTKQEKNYCEKLIKEAERNLEISEDGFKKYDRYKRDGKEIDAEVALRNADYHRGYAEGIYQALVWIGYNSEIMKELTDKM